MEQGAEIQKFFNTMVETEASDLYLTVAKPPMYRIDGTIRAVGDDAFSPQDLVNLSEAMMNEKQRKDFAATLEMNMAMSLPGVARFRVNIFRQRGSVGMVIRRI
jgi:twitching motility protein PilU